MKKIIVTLLAACVLITGNYSTVFANTSNETFYINSPVVIYETVQEENIETSKEAKELLKEQEKYKKSLEEELEKTIFSSNKIILQTEMIFTENRIEYYTIIYKKLKKKEEKKRKEKEEKQRQKEIEEATLYTPSQFMSQGVIYWNGWRWTWYSQQVLPGGGLSIPGRHVDNNGYVCDENDYICLASSTLSRGTVISTPFGKQGKIYDSGCASDTVDVYVNW